MPGNFQGESIMRKSSLSAVFGLFASVLSPVLLAAEGAVPKGIPRLDHVFVIVLENHAFDDVYNNPNMPFTNAWAQEANLATHYFAIGHPSLTNYLEMVGGSNFGVLTDNPPDWHNSTCTPTIAGGAVDGPVCPIAGSGSDVATEASVVDGVNGIPAASDVIGKTLADQLAERRRSWKSYQESLPPAGADRVDYSDGHFTINAELVAFMPLMEPPLAVEHYVDYQQLYAVKHNPFAYFRSVQEGVNRNSSLANVVGFDGADGLYADLARGKVPELAFIVPNQCNDQHGLGNAGAFCSEQTALLMRSDLTVKKLVSAIKASPAWRKGRNAIVLTWDENDFSAANQVFLAVETSYGVRKVSSAQHYTHFSLLRTLESAFRLPCLNHACDNGVAVMSDLFGSK